MRIVCAWCGENMAEGEDGQANPVSHGICLPCLVIQYREMGLSDELIKVRLQARDLPADYITRLLEQKE